MTLTATQSPGDSPGHFSPGSHPRFLPQAYLRGAFLPFEQAQVSIATHTLHYGTGIFGGMRGWPAPDTPNQILLFRLDAHCQRLSHSARYLHYTLEPAVLRARLIDFVHLNKPPFPFYIRPLVYTASLVVTPRLHDVEMDLLIYGMEMRNYFPDTGEVGIRCRISSWLRQADQSLPLRGKVTATYITSALANTEAMMSGFDEAILMNAQGKVSEASAMNLFVVRKGQLITPSVDQDILEGITRDSILILAQDLGIPVIQRPVDKSELFIADELFLCGTAAQIAPIRCIENYTLPDDRPITCQLHDRLKAITQGQDSRYDHWLTRIDL